MRLLAEGGKNGLKRYLYPTVDLRQVYDGDYWKSKLDQYLLFYAGK